MTGALFLGEIGEPSNYQKASQIEKLAGLNLVEKSSGERKGERKISKRGSNILRYVGYLVTNIAISKNKEIKELFHYRLSETGGKEKMKILAGLNAKMLKNRPPLTRYNALRH